MNINSTKSITKFQTPEGEESMSEHSVRNGEAFKTRLDHVEKTLVNLKKSERDLPKNMDYIMNQKTLLQKDLQTADINDDELEDIMGRYFDLAAVIETIEPSYASYRKNEINFDQFCKSFTVKSSNAMENSITQKYDEKSK